MKLSLSILISALIFFSPLNVSAELIPGTTSPMDTLTKDLAWEFIIEKKEDESHHDNGAPLSQDHWRFRSKNPLSKTEAGKQYLRFRLSVFHYENKDQSISEFESLKEKGAHDMGLNYKWNRLYQKGAKIYFLTVPCLFSKPNFDIIVAHLERAIQISEKKETRILHCVCGGSCKEIINE